MSHVLVGALIQRGERRELVRIVLLLLVANTLLVHQI